MNPFRSPSTGGRTPVLAALPSTVADGATVQMRLYDPIDSYGGEWGVSAKEFTAALDALPDGTTEIRLLINSPGGEVWDGLAILNALRSHPARVVAVVEGIAASAASFIAAGADELVMSRNSELYVHNAWGVAMGDAEDMRAAAEDLERLDRNLASIYAEKSGQSVEFWLEEMPKDRFMSAEEAVESGLADRIDGTASAGARARFDLSVFARAERRHAPAAAVTDAQPPVSTEPGEPNRREHVVAYDELKAGICERLGVTDADLDDDAILAALDETLAEQAEEGTTVVSTPPEGTVLVEAEAFAALQANAALGAQARAQQISDRRDGIVNTAIREGRIAPLAQATWRALLEKDEAGTISALATLQPNTVPVAEIGHSDDILSTEEDKALAAAGWGRTKKAEVA